MATTKRVVIPSSIPVAYQMGLNVPVRKPKGSSMTVVEGVCLERAPAAKPTRSLDTFAEMMQSRKLGETVRAPDGRVDDTSLPKHVLTAKQVLTYSAFFKEHVVESGVENHRVRRVLFRYFVEDDTAQVNEVRVTNSGMDQGPFVKRHPLPKAGGGTLHWTDLQIGEDIFLYGRVFRITGVDAFTRKFCEDNGFELNPDTDAPEDKYTTMRQTAMKRETGCDPDAFYGKKANPMKRFMEAHLGNASAVQIRGIPDAKKKFLEHDREVLHFHGVWDDRTRVYGSKERYHVHYFLADDTVEVLEHHEPNNGKDRFPALLKRQRLPKGVVYNDDRSRGIEDDNGDDDYYTEADFKVGATINILGRPVLLFDADPFTMAWVEKHMGVDMRGDVVDVSEPVRVPPTVPPPPVTGYGTDEDSLGSVYHLVPKPPKKDVAKARKYADVILRFSAVMQDAGPIDSLRKFIIAFYPADDTMQIYEPPQRNTGIIGGTFMAKERLRNRDTGEYFAIDDFGEGKPVFARGVTFVLGEPDKRTAKFYDERAATGAGAGAGAGAGVGVGVGVGAEA